MGRVSGAQRPAGPGRPRMGRGGAPGRAAGDLAGLLAPLPLRFLPGLRDRCVPWGDRIAAGGAAGRLGRAERGAGAGGRAARSCEKRAGGGAAHLGPDQLPVTWRESRGAAGRGGTGRGGARRRQASPSPLGPGQVLGGSRRAPSRSSVAASAGSRASGLQETAAQGGQRPSERGRLSWESISFVFIYECGPGGADLSKYPPTAAKSGRPGLGILTL